MYRVSTCLLLAMVLFVWHQAADAGDWDDRPGLDFYRQSSDAAPCGHGVPPPGHFAWEIRPAELPGGLVLTVRQDGRRLCYVTGTNAEAPVIRVRRGETLTITLRNEIANPTAIDEMVASQPLDRPNAPVPEMAGFYPVVPGMRHAATGSTNLHVHGFAVPPVAPQDEVLKTCVDPAIGPATCGQRQVTYHYQIPADMPAGLYWYHPHVHGEVQAQLLMGLSGAIVVEGPDDDRRRAAGMTDRIFIIRQTADRDARRGAAAETTEPAMVHDNDAKPTVAMPAAHDIDRAHELPCSATTGTDEITLNGTWIPDRPVPDDELAHLEIPAGGTQLWRFLNAATDAFLNLALVDQDGHGVPVGIVALDGAPLTSDSGKRLGAVRRSNPQLVPPAGRIEFLVAAPPAGRSIYLVTRAVDTGCAGDHVPERRLALLTAGASGTKAAPVPPAVSAPDFFSGLLARKIDRKRVIAFAEYPRPGGRDEADYYIAERVPGAVLRPYEMGTPPAITVDGGSTEEWVVENWTNELHAFHIHQVHFRLLEIDGKPIADPPLLDVATVPYATPRDAATSRVATPGRIRIRLYFPASLAGDIPFHCHLADHEDNGMMAVLRVLPEAGDLHRQHADLSPGRPPICRATGRSVD